MEIQKANNYPNIRLFTVKLTQNGSDTPMEELIGVSQPWEVGSAGEHFQLAI